ncbi:hypothetical protein D3C72_2072700 [compost metagenome]
MRPGPPGTIIMSKSPQSRSAVVAENRQPSSVAIVSVCFHSSWSWTPGMRARRSAGAT